MRLRRQRRDDMPGQALRPAHPQVTKLKRLLVLDPLFGRSVRDGVVKDYTEIALAGLSRARVTQIVNLLLAAMT